MRYGSVIILTIFSFFTAINIHAQSINKYIFRHIDQSDGLLHNRVFSITQDGKGFIWMLTPNGLQRYDGYRFVNYPYDINNPGGITYTQDCGLFADKKNNCLWIVHENIGKLDLKKNKFIVYPTDQLLPDPQFSFDVYKDSLDNNWFAGNFGILKSDRGGKIKPYYLVASRLAPGKSNSFSIDDKNKIAWLTDWTNGLLLFDKSTQKIYTHNYNPLHNPLLQLMNKTGLFYVFTDSDENTWISSGRQEFYKYNPSTQQLTTYSLTDIKQTLEKNNNPDATLLVRCFFEDDHHALWLGTQNAGLLKYDKEKDNFISITGEKEDQQHIRYNYEINYIFQDSEENIWLGTDKGISIFNPYRQYFKSVYHDENDPLSLPKNELQECIETANGDILVGTWGGGIAVYDNQWHFKKNIHFPSTPEEYNLTWCFIQNDDGTIWVGCQHGYMHIYDPVKETTRTIQPPELNKFTIHCMAKDKDGNILLGLHNGKMAKWNRSENKFYEYNETTGRIPQTFAPVLSIFIDKDQRCWVGTEYGIKQFDPDKMIYTEVYVPDKNNPHSISAPAIQDIEGFDDSTLLIGTVHGGLNFFNTIKKTFTHLKTSNGLPSNTINNLKKDKDHNIWFTTDYDLYRLTPVNNKFVHYNIEPGIINSSFKAGNFYCLRDGRWLANTFSEIISFNPDSLQKQERNNEQVYITGFRVFDKTIFLDSLLSANMPLTLSYQQNFLSIEYSALNFSGLKETKYYYQLTGIDKDWVDGGTKRFANYTNLEPGDYVFNVRAGDDRSDQKITSFKIIITPPFWKTTWFRFMALAVAIAIAYFLLRKRIKAIRHEAELKQRIAETEMMALRAQMNPHFIFNCINSIDAMIQSNDKYHATMYLNKFAKLIRNILDSSKQNLVPLSKDIETLQLYVDLEMFRHRNKFKAEINADPQLLQDDYQVPPLIIQPYVENAILHGLRHRTDNNGKLIVTIQKQNGSLNYEITDNGVGRDKKQPPTNDLKKTNGYGMQICNDRIRIFNKEEEASVQVTDLVDNNEPAGTKVTLQLKIQ